VRSFHACWGIHLSEPFIWRSLESAPVTPPAQSKALDCIKGKKIKITGDYIHPISPVDLEINREADISKELFEFPEEGEDGLGKLPADETKVKNWKGDFVEVVPDGQRDYGFQDETEEDCYKLSFRRGPFEGPGGRCTLTASVRICEDTCTIETGKWELKCDVDDDGKGGATKAWGNFEVIDDD
jgi:hypothetical protein